MILEFLGGVSPVHRLLLLDRLGPPGRLFLVDLEGRLNGWADWTLHSLYPLNSLNQLLLLSLVLLLLLENLWIHLLLVFLELLVDLEGLLHRLFPLFRLYLEELYSSRTSWSYYTLCPLITLVSLFSSNSLYSLSAVFSLYTSSPLLSLYPLNTLRTLGTSYPWNSSYPSLSLYSLCPCLSSLTYFPLYSLYALYSLTTSRAVAPCVPSNPCTPISPIGCGFRLILEHLGGQLDQLYLALRYHQQLLVFPALLLSLANLVFPDTLSPWNQLLPSVQSSLLDQQDLHALQLTYRATITCWTSCTYKRKRQCHSEFLQFL